MSTLSLRRIATSKNCAALDFNQCAFVPLGNRLMQTRTGTVLGSMSGEFKANGLSPKSLRILPSHGANCPWHAVIDADGSDGKRGYCKSLPGWSVHSRFALSVRACRLGRTQRRCLRAYAPYAAWLRKRYGPRSRIWFRRRVNRGPWQRPVQQHNERQDTVSNRGGSARLCPEPIVFRRRRNSSRQRFQTWPTVGHLGQRPLHRQCRLPPERTNLRRATCRHNSAPKYRGRLRLSPGSSPRLRLEVHCRSVENEQPRGAGTLYGDLGCHT